jgi:hypothetical protein
MDGTFGSRLRLQREQQQVALSAIAERTKIKASLLEALERNDVSQWPTGIFRRSFVKSYAQAIGLDGDTVLREFTELYPEPAEEDVTQALAAAHDRRRPPTRLGYLISTAIGALPRRNGAASRAAAESPESRPAEGAMRIAAEAIGEKPAEAGLDVEPPPVESGFGRIQQEPYAESGFGRTTSDLLAEAADDGLVAEDADAARPELDAAPSARREEPALSEIAGLCTRLACAVQPRDVPPVLEDAARLLAACGVIVWMWDPATRSLGHVLAHGYSSGVLARLPRVRWEADNAIAEAFRTGATRIVNGSGASTGAVVVPILAAGGCAGVLALELQDRGEERECVRAAAAILAAQFAASFGFQSIAEAVSA